MKAIGITQRVAVIEEYAERRDCLDQRWTDFFYAAEFTLVPLPNRPNVAVDMVEQLALAGIVLTGGNNIVKYGGDAPERDETERLLLEKSLEKKIPLLGVCRGMQVIQDYFSVPLQKISGHVCVEQEIVIDGQREKVNSFHDYGAYENRSPLETWAKSDDGIIKAIRHSAMPVKGVMWHPERFPVFRDEDVLMVQSLFKEE